jgi:hypothetical protein
MWPLISYRRLLEVVFHGISSYQYCSKIVLAHSTQPLRDIWSDVLSDSSDAVERSLRFETAESIMRNKRKKNYPPIPQSLDTMITALEGDHPFVSIYQGKVEFEDGKIGFIFADPELLAVVQRNNSHVIILLIVLSVL